MSDRPAQIGPFDILDELGRGAMGVVYRARHRELDREFALKVVGDRMSDRPDALARFRREAQAAARLAGHPNIVGVHQIGESDGLAWFSMDLVDGQSLESLIDEGDLSLEEAARIVAKAARAVDHAHDASVLHRDLKPANILVGHDGAVHVTDFGLARLQDVAADLTRITTSDLLVGTPAYMAPEQIHGESLDGRADVYSLGATLYEAITGSVPFPGSSILSVLTKVVQEPPPAPTSLAPGIPADLEAITLRALAKAPADRYPTAILLAEELEAFLAGKPILARRSSVVGRIGKRFRRNRPLTVLAGVAVVSALAGGVAVWVATRQRGDGEAAVKQAQEGATTAERGVAYSAAHYYIESNARQAIARLMHRFHGAWAERARDEAALAEVRRVCDEAEAAHPGARAPAAWRAFCAHLVAPDQDSYDVMIAEANDGGDDPYPAMLGARMALKQYCARLTVPASDVTGDQISLERFVEGDFVRQFRTDLTNCLDRINASPHWRTTPGAHTLERFVEGAGFLLEGKWHQMRTVFTPLMEDSGLGIDARQAVGYAQFQQSEYGAAAATWARLADFGWWGATRDTSRAFESAISYALQQGDDAETPARAYRDFLERLAQVQPASPYTWRGRSDAFRWLALIAKKTGADPRPDLDRAVAAADRLLELVPESKWAHYQRGQARLELFGILAERGDASRDRFEEVRADLLESLRRTPEDSQSGGMLGVLHATAGGHLGASHPAAEGMFRKAIEYFSTAVEWQRARGGRGDRVNRGMAYMQLAEVLAARGEPYAGEVAQSLADLQAMLEREPGRLRVLDAMASIHLFQSERTGEAAGDPVPDVQTAIDYYSRVLTRSPNRATTLSNRGLAWRRLGDAFRNRAQPAVEAYDHAVADLRRAVERSPGESTYHMNLASVLRSRGQAAADAGGDSTPDLLSALESLNRAIVLSPTSVAAWGTRGQVRANLAQAREQEFEEAVMMYRQAIEDYAQAVTLAPTDARSLSNRADAWRALANAQAAHHGDWHEAMEAAMQDYGAALAIVPRHPIIFYNRAIAFERTGYWGAKLGNDPAPAYDAAIADLLACTEINPRMAPAWQLLARVQRDAGRYPDALASLDRALEIRPGYEQYLRERAKVVTLMDARAK